MTIETTTKDTQAALRVIDTMARTCEVVHDGLMAMRKEACGFRDAWEQARINDARCQLYAAKCALAGAVRELERLANGRQ